MKLIGIFKPSLRIISTLVKNVQLMIIVITSWLKNQPQKEPKKFILIR